MLIDMKSLEENLKKSEFEKVLKEKEDEYKNYIEKICNIYVFLFLRLLISENMLKKICFYQIVETEKETMNIKEFYKEYCRKAKRDLYLYFDTESFDNDYCKVLLNSFFPFDLFSKMIRLNDNEGYVKMNNILISFRDEILLPGQKGYVEGLNTVRDKIRHLKFDIYFIKRMIDFSLEDYCI